MDLSYFTTRKLTSIECIIERAKQKVCNMLQLILDKQRPEAIRFYETIGFCASHEGVKFKF